MAKYFQFLPFLLFYFLNCSTLCPAIPYSCSHDESLLLLAFKESFTIDQSYYYYLCQSSYPQIKSWNKSTNCCTWEGVTCDNITGNVIELDLSCGKLNGSIDSDSSLFRLPHIRRLNLSYNPIKISQISMIFHNFSSSLEYLDLNEVQLLGKIPDTVGNLMALKYLDLSYCGISGSLPKEIFTNMTQIETILLTGNLLIGSIPSFPREMKHLKKLDLSYNFLSGPLELSILVNLQELDLSDNQLSGHLPVELSSLFNLQKIDLSHNQLYGPVELSSLINLQYLNLRFNQLTGHLLIELLNLVNLQWLDIRDNRFSGHLPKELSSLVNLQVLDLESNNFSGEVHVDLFSNMKQLRSLSLSHNRLSLFSKKSSTLPESIRILQLASCNITELDFLRSASDIPFISLSLNNIREIPSWLWSKWDNIIELNISNNYITHLRDIHFQQIQLLDIRSNLIQGQFPQVPATIVRMFISNNQFSEMIPSSVVCRLSKLQLLDLSNNRFTGSIPQCIGSMSQFLSVLDMRKNKFQGTIPTNISSMILTTLNLHGNHLTGNIPLSLATCMNLKFLDLGNNNLSDTFPSWLEVIPDLTVLSLRSNRFHGTINLSTTSSFSKLQILDLSHNEFNGTLPPELFNNFSSMMEINETSHSASYMGDDYSMIYEDFTTLVSYSGKDYYEDSTTLVNKGTEVELDKIITTWSTIDLSSNNFEGNIPNSVGRLISIRQLNFSNNRLKGEIPTSFGNLSSLEALDLSSNQLTGTIPTQLTTLHFLSNLNLSNNHLTGRIPGGPQFQTFGNNSYMDNAGLCGFPLSERCGGDKEEVEDYLHDSEFFDGFSWRCVIMGYGVGIVLGLGIGVVMILTEKPAWIIRMVEDEGHRMVMKRDRKKKIFKRTGRRN